MRVGIIFGLLPAIRAARKDPIDPVRRIQEKNLLP